MWKAMMDWWTFQRVKRLRRKYAKGSWWATALRLAEIGDEREDRPSAPVDRR